MINFIRPSITLYVKIYLLSVRLASEYYVVDSSGCYLKIFLALRDTMTLKITLISDLVNKNVELKPFLRAYWI